MRIKYTVTTLTTKCPHCGYILDEQKHGEFAPIIAGLWFITLPMLIPYWLIKLGLGFPKIPKIGPKVTTCPNCSLPVQTDNLAFEDLNKEALLTYRFRIWFYLGYILGAIFSFSLIYLLLDGLQIVSWCGLISLFSLLGVVAIIVAYRLKIANLTSKRVDMSTTKRVPNKKTEEFFYCRKCGKKLPVDSNFCDCCGAQVVFVQKD